MGILTPVAASLVVTSGTIKSGTVGAALNQGVFAYIDSADSNKLKAANNLSTAAIAAVEAVLLQSVAADGQRVEYLVWEAGAAFEPGATLTIGTTYWLGTNGRATDIAPVSGEQVTIIGVATTTAVLSHVANSGVAVP